MNKTIDKLDAPTDFSLVLGGPLFQLLRRAHLSDDALMMARQRIIVISLFAWLPLLLLSALQGQLLGGRVAVPFLLDVEVHVKFLLAMPLLVTSAPAITLRIEKDQIVGAAGCNNYFTPYTSEGPGKIKVAAIGATRKACSAPIMDLEARYLKALEDLTSYSSLAGRLALTYRRDSSFATLLFTPRANLSAD